MTSRFATISDDCREGIPGEWELADAAGVITLFIAAIAHFFFFLVGGAGADAAADADADAAGARVGAPTATGARVCTGAAPRERRNSNISLVFAAS